MHAQLQVVILAAGKSSRFNTAKTKLAHTICGLEMVVYPVKLAAQFTSEIAVVVGYQQELIQETLSKYSYPVTYCPQTVQAGTGHALRCTQHTWTKEHILVMNGDMPLVSEDMINQLFEAHTTTNAAMSFVTSYCDEPNNQYGRVVDSNGKIAIIETKNLLQHGYTQDITRINAGIYLFKRDFLESALAQLTHDSLTQEIYITDLAAYAGQHNLTVTTVSAPFDTIRGVNTLKELWTVEHIKRSELINHFMTQGVRFEAAQHVILDHDVSIGADTHIGAGVILRAGTHIGRHCYIDAFSALENTILGDGVTIHSHSHLADSRVADGAQVGPFARVHRNSVIAQEGVIGNFVEISKSTVGQQSKIKHLSYIGQANVGNQVNIGAGTITCNYNGVTKHATEIKDNAFIGSNSCLIAPVTIGTGSFVAAGSTITQSIGDEAFAIARERQITKEHYAPLLKQKYRAAKKIERVTT